MFKILSILAVIVSSSIVTQSNASINSQLTIEHLTSGDMHFVSVGESHFGFLHKHNNIPTVISVNDNKVLLYQSDCTFSIKEKSELTGVDSDELDSLKALIHSHGNIYDYLINDNEASREIFDPTNLSNSESKHTIIRDSEKRKINLYKYASSDSVQHKNGEFSIPGPFEHLARTFQQGKFVTYVYNDGFVLMKPSWCQTVDDINSLYPQPIANNLLNPTSFVNPMIQPNFGWTNQI